MRTSHLRVVQYSRWVTKASHWYTTMPSHGKLVMSSSSSPMPSAVTAKFVVLEKVKDKNFGWNEDFLGGTWERIGGEFEVREGNYGLEFGMEGEKRGLGVWGGFSWLGEERKREGNRRAIGVCFFALVREANQGLARVHGQGNGGSGGDEVMMG